MVSTARVRSRATRICTSWASQTSVGRRRTKQTSIYLFLKVQSTFFADCGEIKVGRGVDTDVRVTDVLSSKIQFTLFFTQGDWYISNGYKSRIPSNPCWVLLTNEAPIWQKTRIKYNETIFEVIFYWVGRKTYRLYKRRTYRNFKQCTQIVMCWLSAGFGPLFIFNYLRFLTYSFHQRDQMFLLLHKITGRQVHTQNKFRFKKINSPNLLFGSGLIIGPPSSLE